MSSSFNFMPPGQRTLDALQRSATEFMIMYADLKKSEKNIAELDKKIIAAQQGEEEARQQQAVARQQQVEAQAKIVTIDAKLDKLVAGVFYGVFGLKLADTDPVEPIISQYLSDQSIYFDEQNDRCFKIKSMAPIISFLNDHKEIKTLNFKAFKKEAPKDIETLSQYLSNSTCNIKAICINNSLSSEDKAILANVQKAKPKFVIQYFA